MFTLNFLLLNNFHWGVEWLLNISLFLMESLGVSIKVVMKIEEGTPMN